MAIERQRRVKAQGRKQVYFMACAEIVFRMKEDEPLNMVRVNTVVMSDTGDLAVRDLAKIQQGAQMQFHKNMQDPSVTIIDVVILGITRLGVFTAEEFNASPQGMEARPVDPTDAAGHA